MSGLQTFFYAFVTIGICYLLYRQVRHNPEWTSRKNLGRSAQTLGFLALILMGFIGLCVLLLRA